MILAPNCKIKYMLHLYHERLAKIGKIWNLTPHKLAKNESLKNSQIKF